jgi:hypothetical protein
LEEIQIYEKNSELVPLPRKGATKKKVIMISMKEKNEEK